MSLSPLQRGILDAIAGHPMSITDIRGCRVDNARLPHLLELVAMGYAEVVGVPKAGRVVNTYVATAAGVAAAQEQGAGWPCELCEQWPWADNRREKERCAAPVDGEMDE